MNSFFKRTMIAAINLFLLATPGWSSAALSGGIEGNGANRSAVPLGDKVLKLSFGTQYATGENLNGKRLSDPDAEGNRVWEDVNGTLSRVDLGFAVAFGATSFLDLSLYLPYYLDSDERGKDFSGTGDLKLSFKFNYPPYKHNPLFELAYLLAFDLPTGNDQKEGGFVRNPYSTARHNELIPGVYSQESDWVPYSSQSTVTTMMLLLTMNLKASQNRVPLLLHGNFGLSLSETKLENVFHLGGGAEFWFGQFIALIWSTQGEMDVSHATKHIRIAAFPMAHRIGLMGYVPDAGLGIEAGVQLVTNLKTGSDKEWGECATLGSSVCGDWSGDVQDNGDVDYIHNQTAPENQLKYSRVPSFAIYAGISIAIKLSDTDDDVDDY